MNKRNSKLTRNKKAIALAVAACFAAVPAFAVPTNPTVVSGSASFSTSGSTLTVTNTPKAIINWASFSIDPGETVRFVQPSAASSVLNRVTGADPSHLLGALQSNGKVFLVNPNGIIFGANARIDVNGLIASTLDITDNDFLNGRLRFAADRVHPGSITNAGQITTPAGGFVYLLAPNVENSGVITTPSGEAILAAGHSVEIVDSTDPSQRVQVSATVADVNLSQLMTQSGGNIFSVLNSGRVSANTAVQDATGKIYFKSAGNITTATTSVVEAKGDVAADGGAFIGFADGHGRYAGVFDATGRNGGFIETSGSTLDFAGISVRAGALAPGGQAGTWLLDPGDLTVSGTDGDTISSVLNNGTNVFLETNSGGCAGIGACNTSGSGYISFDNVSISNSYGGYATSLHVNAYGDIVFQGTNTFSNSGTGFNLYLDAGYGGGPGAHIISSGNLTFNNTAGGPLTVNLFDTEAWENHGTLTLNGPVNIDLNYNDDTFMGTFYNSNGATVNIVNSNTWAFLSDPDNQNGPVINSGVMRVNGNTSFEALYMNNPGSTLVVESGTLSLQNAHVLAGQVTVQPGATLWISEAHSGNRTFSNAVIDIQSGGFFRYNALVDVTNSTFKLDGSLVKDTNGYLDFSDSIITSSGDLTVPGDSLGVHYSGTWMEFSAKGNLTIDSDPSDLYDGPSELGFWAGGQINATGADIAADVVLMGAQGGINITTNSYIEAYDFMGLYAMSESAGDAIDAYLDTVTGTPTYGNVVDIFNLVQSNADVVIDNSSVVYSYSDLQMVGNNVRLGDSYASAGDGMMVMAKNDILLSGSSLFAGTELLAVAGRSIRLENESEIYVGSPLTLYFGFPLLTTGGWFVDGVEGSFGTFDTSYCASGASCILVDYGPPIPGVNFFAIYGGGLPTQVLGPMYENGMSSFLYDESLYQVESPTGEDFFGKEEDEEEKKNNPPQQCSA